MNNFKTQLVSDEEFNISLIPPAVAGVVKETIEGLSVP